MSQRPDFYNLPPTYPNPFLPPWLPLPGVDLVGSGIMRVVPIVLPTSTVRSFLPYTLDLDQQTLTPPGTHPIVMFFQDMIRAHMSIPSLLPNMTYYEYVLAVPYTRVSGTAGDGRQAGLQFMPRLYLSEYLPTLGGRLFWGFAKEMAQFRVTSDRITISDFQGRPILSLDYLPQGDYQPVGHYPHFGPLREIMSEPLVSQLPLALGPFLACSNYVKDWSRAVLRPLRTEVTVHESFIPNLPCGRFVNQNSIVQSPFASVEVQAPWALSTLYPTWMP